MCVSCPRSDLNISGAACQGYVLRQAGCQWCVRSATHYIVLQNNFVLWSFRGSAFKSATVTKHQVHVFSARHWIPQVVGVFGSSRDVGHHSFNQIYRHGLLGIYRKAGAWIRVFPIRMVWVSPKAFSASREIRKFFHRVCLDLILVETGVFSHWHCPMGAMKTPVTPPFHVGWCKVAGWSAWCWQSHTDLKNCKRQFRELLWNRCFPSDQ